MKLNKTSPLLLLGLVFLTLLGWGLYASIEFYEETERSGWSLEALRNPYLAAQRFMTASDIEVTDVDSLVKLEQLDGLGTLFFSDANQVRNPRQLSQVMDWLQAGGNVIYSANEVDHDDDLLLSKFSVEVELRKREEGDDAAKPLSEKLRDYNREVEKGRSREDIARELDRPETAITRIHFGDEIGEIEVAFDTSRVLQHVGISADSAEVDHQPFSWSSSEYGVHMMQFEVGDGLLTVLSDPGIWTSYEIDKYDHAYLLWLLSSGDGNFAILRSVLRESVWVLLKRHASELLIATGLFIAFLLWRLGSRFGRLLPRELSRRRALGEHFSSVSLYLWHRRRGAYLLAPLRQSVLRRASLSLGEFTRAEPARQLELIAQRCGVDVESVARALNHDDFNEASFVDTVRLLKHIEHSL